MTISYINIIYTPIKSTDVGFWYLIRFLSYINIHPLFLTQYSVLTIQVQLYTGYIPGTWARYTLKKKRYVESVQQYGHIGTRYVLRTAIIICGLICTHSVHYLQSILFICVRNWCNMVNSIINTAVR